VSDFLEQDSRNSTPADLVNFGFETSLDALQAKKRLFAPDALILAPISSDPQGSLEQSYTLLSNQGDSF
jgi:hypothetical protein